MSEAPIQDGSLETGGCGLLGCSILVVARDRLVHSFSARVGEAAWSVAVVRGDVPGVQLGADPADRLIVGVGSVSVVPVGPAVWGLGQAHRLLLPLGRGEDP